MVAFLNKNASLLTGNNYLKCKERGNFRTKASSLSKVTEEGDKLVNKDSNDSFWHQKKEFSKQYEHS